MFSVLVKNAENVQLHIYIINH